MKSDNLYIDQIRDAIRKLESYTKGFVMEQFMKDEKTQSAVVLQMLLIGEVSKKISEETKAKFDVPWKKIMGFRDNAVHNYYEINLRIVWETLSADIPTLKEKIKEHLE